jgi:predicted transcriptional regulator
MGLDRRRRAGDSRVVQPEPTRVRFARFARDRGLSQIALGVLLEVGQNTVSRVMTGRRGCGAGLAARIEQLTDGAIAASDWVRTPEERAADQARPTRGRRS